MQEKLLELTRKFNTEDDFNNLTWIFIEESKTIIDLIKTLNKNISQEKINKYKFAILKISDNFLIYINKSGEIEYSDTSIHSLESILKDLKDFENKSKVNNVYTDQMKSSLLVLGKGKISNEMSKSTIDIESTKKEIAKLKTREERYTNAYSEEVITLDKLKEYLTPIKVSVASLEKSLAQVSVSQESKNVMNFPSNEEIEFFAGKVVKTAGTLSFEAKKGIMLGLLDRISSTQKSMQVYGAFNLNEIYVKYLTDDRHRGASQCGQVDTL